MFAHSLFAHLLNTANEAGSTTPAKSTESSNANMGKATWRRSRLQFTGEQTDAYDEMWKPIYLGSKMNRFVKSQPSTWAGFLRPWHK
jgi:hypothetical protein